MPRFFPEGGLYFFMRLWNAISRYKFYGNREKKIRYCHCNLLFFPFRPWSNNTLWIFVSPLCVRVSHSSIFGGYTFWNVARKSQTAIATVQGSKQHCRLSLLFSEFSIRYLYNLPQHARSELSFRQYKLHNYGHFSPLKDERYIQNDLFRSL